MKLWLGKRDHSLVPLVPAWMRPESPDWKHSLQFEQAKFKGAKRGGFDKNKINQDKVRNSKNFEYSYSQ